VEKTIAEELERLARMPVAQLRARYTGPAGTGVNFIGRDAGAGFAEHQFQGRRSSWQQSLAAARNNRGRVRFQMAKTTKLFKSCNRSL